MDIYTSAHASDHYGQSPEDITLRQEHDTGASNTVVLGSCHGKEFCVIEWHQHNSCVTFNHLVRRCVLVDPGYMGSSYTPHSVSILRDKKLGLDAVIAIVKICGGNHGIKWLLAAYDSDGSKYIHTVFDAPPQLTQPDKYTCMIDRLHQVAINIHLDRDEEGDSRFEFVAPV